MNHRSCTLCFVVAIGAGCPTLAQPQGSGSGSYTTVALAGDPAPVGGALDYFFQAPVINSRGNILIRATHRPTPTSVPIHGMLFGAAGDLSIPIDQLHTFTDEPDAPQFNSARTWSLGDNDTISISGLITLPGTSRWAVMSGRPGAIRIVARETHPAPGVLNRPFVDLSTRAPVNSSGQIVFAGKVNSTPWGVWMTDSGGILQPVAVPYQSAPVMGTTWRWDSLNYGPVLSDTGIAAFIPIARNTQDNRTESAVAVGDHLGLTVLARRGAQAAGFPSGTTYDALRGPSISRDGRVVFPGRARLASEYITGLWASTDAGGVRAVVVGTQALPGTPEGSTVLGVPLASINSSGSIMFTAKLATGGPITASNNDAIWLEREGVLTAIVREEDPIPGLGDTHMWFSDLDRYSQLNESHQFAMRALVYGEAVAEPKDWALLAWDPDLGLQVIALVGGEFQVAPGDVRTISAIDFANSHIRVMDAMGPVGTGGTETGLNDRGQVAFTLRFTDNSHGIFIYTIGGCPADWSGDGVINSGDISAFLTSWLASLQGGTVEADFNGDGETNSGDISAFLTAWLNSVQGGC